MNENHFKILKTLSEHNMPLGAAFLGKEVGLSQATVGRILAYLEKNGYLEKISNKGRYITPNGLNALIQQEQFKEKLNTAKSIIETAASNSKEKLNEILELRLGIEPFSAERACLNATNDDIKQLNNIMLEHIYDINRGGIGSEQDLQLHLKIAEISGNKTLYHVLRLVLTQENAYTKFSMVASHLTDTQIKQHSNIIEAIQMKDVEKSREAMTTHLKQVIDDVNKYYTEQ